MVATPSAPVALERLLVNTAATLSWQPTDYLGEIANPGTVTATVTRADGTVIATAAATGGATTAPRTYALTQANNGQLDMLQVVWKVGSTIWATTLHEIVGGFYFSLAELETFDTTLGDITDGGSTQARAVRVREEVERECERLTGVAWVPRYRRVALSGLQTNSLVLPNWYPRTIRSVRVYSSATDYTSFSASELAAIETKNWGEIIRRDWFTFIWGIENVVIEYEHGHDRPPQDLRHACMSRFRQRWNMEVAPVGAEAASSWTVPGGATYQFPGDQIGDEAPGMSREVRQVYRQHSKRIPGLA